jgi:hypothetical protein
MSDVVSPTQEQFQETARKAFDFLQRENGFGEIPTEYDDPFGLQYQNNHCRVQVIGRSFGFGIDVGVVRLDYNAKVDQFAGVFPLWCVLKLRDPELYYKRFHHTSGQLKMLRMDAGALREHCQDLLVGDFSIEVQISALLRKSWEESKEEDRKEEARWKYERATAAANEAFHKKEYVEVVKQLETVKDHLTPSQLKKLAYARKHKQKSFIQKFFHKK